MRRASVTELRLRAIAARVTLLPVDQLDPDEELSRSGIDSLSLLRIVAEVESAFSIHIADEEFVGIGSLGALARLVEARTRTAA